MTATSSQDHHPAVRRRSFDSLSADIPDNSHDDGNVGGNVGGHGGGGGGGGDDGRRRVTFGVADGGVGIGVVSDGGGGPRRSPSARTGASEVRGGILHATNNNGGGGNNNNKDHHLLRDPTRRQRQRDLLWRAGIAFALFVACRSFLWVDVSAPPPATGGHGGGGGGTGAYRGTPWHNERTLAVRTLAETKFARCDVHTVLGEDGTTVTNDWIFLEEMPAVNVVVHTLEGRYVVFRQRKYAVPGETLSPVGGFVDAGESPVAAARREVLEELGLGSRRTLRTIREGVVGGGGAYDNGRSTSRRDGPDVGRTSSIEVGDVAKIMADAANPPAYDGHGLMDGFARSIPNVDYDADWVYLGRYRTAANRGGGFVYSYLLRNAVPLVPGGGTVNYNGNGGDDESQRILYLDEDEVMRALAGGKFQEVKWAATFALAMLHVRGGMPACCGAKTEWDPPV
jgi:8-oxo-dGTP pyrophosphatase MutT (NUDIX family)